MPAACRVLERALVPEPKAEPKEKIEAQQVHRNPAGPHSGLGHPTPKAFAA